MLAGSVYVTTMDDDMQNLPEDVACLYDHAQEGDWDVIYTRYPVKQHAGWRTLSSRSANASADRLLDKPRGLCVSSFRCLLALAVRTATGYIRFYPSVDGLIIQVAKSIDRFEVEHVPRMQRRSNDTITRLVQPWLPHGTVRSVQRGNHGRIVL